MLKETKACEVQKIQDELRELWEPFKRMLKELYGDLFQQEFRKRLIWDGETLWYLDSEQGPKYSVSSLASELGNTQKFYGELVGPQGGLNARDRGKGRKDFAIILLEQGYRLQEDINREMMESLEQKIEQFLEEHHVDDVDRKELIRQFKQELPDRMRKELYRGAESLQHTDKTLHRSFLKPAFERLRSDLAQRSESINLCAAGLLPVISKGAPGKPAEELEERSRDAAVVNILLHNLLDKYFVSVIAGG